MVTSRRAEVPFNMRQRAAALRRQIADMELRQQNLSAQLKAKRTELLEIEQMIDEQSEEQGL